MPAIFSNSVPEAPWWDKVRHAATPSGPTSLTWTLSGDILFDSGSANLSAAALSQLSGVLTVAQRHCDAAITVIGYTDSVPDPTFPGGNQGLSSARADTVANVFEAADISGDHLQADGGGTTNPVGNNDTASGRQANRRVVIELSAPATSCPASPRSPTISG
jgi:outer membrane protein OmpA-like peptidoglycan-associated protein